MPIEVFLDHEFIGWVRQMSKKMRDYLGDRVVVVHHNDADGICSAAILSKLYEYLGLKTEFVCLEKVHPLLLERIHSKYEGDVIVYTDLAGLAADMIDKVNAGRCTVWIVDHHPSASVKSETVFVLAPEILGISGDMFVSASTLNYLLSMNLSNEMRKYAYLAVIGSVGDYHDRSGGVLGFDRFALEEALDLGQAKIKIERARERYFISFFNEFADIIAGRLTNLGTVAYEKKGYKKGIKACLEGFDERTISEAEKLDEIKNRKFEEAIEMLRSGKLHSEKYTQWFHLEDSFSPMGVKAVGEFCQKIKDMVFIKEDKYLLGLQNCPKHIPDLGKIEWNAVKVSGRVPTPLERKIRRGEALGLEVLFPAASKAVGGIANATHRTAAATLVEKGKEREFIRAFEGVVEM